MTRPLVLYHSGCVDGFCSAWVAKSAMPDAECVPVNYGQDPPDVTGLDVFILDFSYKRPVMRSVLSQAHRVTVLDHHKTAEAELAGIVDEFVQRPDLIANPPGSELPVVHFDMNKSGGRLTWEHFFPGKPSPWLVDYTEDRDLWRHELPHTQEISAFIRSYPLLPTEQNFLRWSNWACPGTDSFNAFIDQGLAILRYQQQIIDLAVSNAVEMVLDGHKILAVNTTVCFSEVAGQLAKGRPFGAAYFIRADGKRQWSLRSALDGLDVSEIAKRHGGGGHRNAAGFEEAA